MHKQIERSDTGSVAYDAGSDTDIGNAPRKDKTRVRWLQACSKRETARMNTTELRANYMATGLSLPGMINLIYWEHERTVVGIATPTTEELELTGGELLKSEFFCQRREAGIVNLGKNGSLTIDGKRQPMQTFDFAYIGAGTESVVFGSDDAAQPALFYIVSYPAHRRSPSQHIPRANREVRSMGSTHTCNQREIDAVLTPERVNSCQLVMGMTMLTERSVWNTMPCHTHARRSEVYCYFSVAEDAVVIHLMGEPDETRHLVVRNLEVVLSPNWSIHSGVGTSNYGFIWAMGGENQAFDDMDMVAISDLR